MITGYLHPDYAKSLGEFGRPIELPSCRGWLLERPISETTRHDVTGCYPLFCCQNWSGLQDDLEEISSKYVTCTLVLDPFQSLSDSQLEMNFDQVTPFKKHYVIDLSEFSEDTPTSHHRYYARRALQTVEVRLVDRPGEFLDDWLSLYEVLIARHQLRGLKAFSRDSFSRQLSIPGLRMFIAQSSGQTFAAHLWFLQDDIAYSHLSAFSHEGYRCSASYGLYWSAIQYFKNKSPVPIRWLDLGGGAGLEESKDGLSQFKKGWANSARTKLLCTRVFDREIYRELLCSTRTESTSYFPEYRSGEVA